MKTSAKISSKSVVPVLSSFLGSLLSVAAVVGVCTFSSSSVFAETTTGEKIQEGAEDAGKNTKQAFRGAKDKACEMVNGKLECAGKKALNKARNAKDEVKDKADDVQKKVD